MTCRQRRPRLIARNLRSHIYDRSRTNRRCRRAGTWCAGPVECECGFSWVEVFPWEARGDFECPRCHGGEGCTS